MRKKYELRCDICGDDMLRTIKFVRSDGKVVKRKNIGLMIHKRDGTMIKRCLKCHRIIKTKKNYKKRRKTSYMEVSKNGKIYT